MHTRVCGWLMVLAIMALVVACGGGESSDPTAEPTEADATETAEGPTEEPTESATATDEPDDETPEPSATGEPTEAATDTPAATATTGATATAAPTKTRPPAATNTPVPAPPTATPWPATNATINGNPATWSPSSVVGGVGTTVTWKWADNLHVHNLSVDGMLAAETPVKVATKTLTFNTRGTFNFRCEAHADTMTGTVEIR